MANLSRTSRFASLVVVSVLLASSAGCSDDDPGSTPSTTAVTSTEPGASVRQPALEGVVSVVAADSLAEAMPALIERFNAANPNVEVTARFDSTPVLAMELLDGAPADVFISADLANMDALADSGRTDGPPQVLAESRLVIVAPAGNPDGIVGLGDLAAVDAVALCESGTPCGAVADAALDAAGVDPGGADRVPTGAAAVAAVADGDAGAALAFGTSAQAAGGAVEVIDLPDGVEATTTYTVATLAPAVNALAARAFLDFVRSPEALDILGDFGFLPPA